MHYNRKRASDIVRTASILRTGNMLQLRGRVVLAEVYFDWLLVLFALHFNSSGSRNVLQSKNSLLLTKVDYNTCIIFI